MAQQREDVGTSDRRPGAQADAPSQIPARGWGEVLGRAWKEGKDDNLSMLAGGVAFFGFLAVFPALIALLTLYGLVADPAQAAQRIEQFSASLPQASQQLITEQLTAVTQTSGGALTVGLVVALLAALWSASSGTQNLMAAVNLAYDEKEGRGAVKLRAIALALTLGAVVFVVVALALVAVVPAVLDTLGLGPVVEVAVQVLRWALLVGLVTLGLAVVYRVAPDRVAPQFRWVSPGALVATVLWIIGSAAFSLYVNNFGSYNKTYGALAGVIVLMLWLYLTSYIVLLGAEINSESELQTARDTTHGESEPMGRRGALVADSEPARKG